MKGGRHEEIKLHANEVTGRGWQAPRRVGLGMLGVGGQPWPVFASQGFEDKHDPTTYFFIFGALTGQESGRRCGDVSCDPGSQRREGQKQSQGRGWEVAESGDEVAA